MEKPIWTYCAGEIALAIANGRITARAVIEAHIERIAKVNPHVNAITQVLEDSAFSAAENIDRRRAAGEALGPFAGVPFTVKESIDVAGSPTTYGVEALRQVIPPIDAPIVERLRSAGAIPIGRTNLPDMSLRFHTESQLYGETINPWNRSCSPGGSSGGEGVALSTGMSPLGLGNDAGGSVRVPALFGGVAGLKPSFGRIPSDRSILPRDMSFASQVIPVEGVLARSVGDLNLALKLLAGADMRDPRVVPCSTEGQQPARPIRVAVVADPGGLGAHPDVRAAVTRAAEALNAAGYITEETDVPRLDECLTAYGGLIMTEFNEVWETLARLLGNDGRRYIELSMALRKPVGLRDYIQLTALRQGLQRAWAEFLNRYPLVLGPVYTDLPPAPRFDIKGLEELDSINQALRMCSATSLLGLPAVAVPTGVVNQFPQGVQVIANMYREDLCLEAAAIIEAACGRQTPINPRL